MKDIFDLQASFYRMFTDPVRLRLLWTMQLNEMTIEDVARHTDLSPYLVAHQLKLMQQNGLLTKRLKGDQAYYRITNIKVLEGCRKIREGILDEMLHKQAKKDDASSSQLRKLASDSFPGIKRG